MKIREKLARWLYPQVFKDHDYWMWSAKDTVKQMKKVSDKTPIDLTREALKLTPLDLDYGIDMSKYDKEDYLIHAKELLENPMFHDEIKRILFERVNFVAMQSPAHDSDMIARGAIDGVSQLKERVLQYKEAFDQKIKDRKERDEEIENDVTGLI